MAAAALMLVVLATNVLGSWRLTSRFNLPFSPAKGTPAPVEAPELPELPSASMPPRSPNEPLLSEATLDTILTVIVVIVVLAAAVFVGGLLWRLRRTPDEAADGAAQVSVHEVVRDAVQTARNYLLANRDTGDIAGNIIGAWAALEQAAAESGHRRRPEHTPSEFTAQLLHSVSGAQAEITELLGLYHRARYGNSDAIATLTPADSSRAVNLLAAIADQMDDHPDAAFRRPRDDQAADDQTGDDQTGDDHDGPAGDVGMTTPERRHE